MRAPDQHVCYLRAFGATPHRVEARRRLHNIPRRPRNVEIRMDARLMVLWVFSVYDERALLVQFSWRPSSSFNLDSATAVEDRGNCRQSVRSSGVSQTADL